MFSWKKINKNLHRTVKNLKKTRRIIGGYLVKSVKKNNKNNTPNKNKKNRTYKSHMSSLLPAIMNNH